MVKLLEIIILFMKKIADYYNSLQSDLQLTVEINSIRVIFLLPNK